MEPVQATDPETIGPYRILGLLGAGGMGRVYLGVDRDGRHAAVKMVNAELLRDPEFRKRFTREATATAKVDGRLIAGIVASDIDSEHPWLATDYIDGPALSDVVADQGPLSPARAQEMAAGLAEALSTIHAAGVVHRDVKPANVLLAPHGPHLIDFGIARDSAASTITRTGIVVGTPPYMAPEQIRGRRKVGPPADVFALGGVLAFALTGRHPFGEADATTLAYRIAHEEPDLDGVTDEIIKALIITCLAKEPNDRPSAAELLEQLGRIDTRSVVVAGAAAAPDTVAPPGVGERTVSGAAAEATAEMTATEPLDGEAAATPGDDAVEQETTEQSAGDDAVEQAPIATAAPPPTDPVEQETTEQPAEPRPGDADARSQEPATPPNLDEPPATAAARPTRRRRLATAVLAAVVIVIAGAGILGADLIHGGKKGPDPSAAGRTSAAASSPDSPSGTPGSSAPSGDPASGQPASAPGSPSGITSPSLSGPTSSAQNPPPPAGSTAGAPGPGTVTSSRATSRGTTAPPPHTTSQSNKPPTSNPPPSSPPRNTAPATPTNAKVLAAMDPNFEYYIMTFTWSAVSNASSYDVHYTFFDGNGNKTTDEIDSVTGTSYQAPPFKDPSAKACFNVRAVNAYGVSDWDSSTPHCG